MVGGGNFMFITANHRIEYHTLASIHESVSKLTDYMSIKAIKSLWLDEIKLTG
ncbi:hypothetical protein NBRC116595_38840 [Aliiglaciecola sp. NS0011-25]